MYIILIMLIPYVLFLIGVYFTCRDKPCIKNTTDKKSAHKEMMEDKFFNQIYEQMKSN